MFVPFHIVFGEPLRSARSVRLTSRSIITALSLSRSPCLPRSFLSSKFVPRTVTTLVLSLWDQLELARQQPVTTSLSYVHFTGSRIIHPSQPRLKNKVSKDIQTVKDRRNYQSSEDLKTAVRFKTLIKPVRTDEQNQSAKTLKLVSTDSQQRSVKTYKQSAQTNKRSDKTNKQSAQTQTRSQIRLKIRSEKTYI